MTKIGRHALAALFVGIASVTSAAEGFRQLKAAEIKSRFAGKEFTDEVHWAMVFGPDGSLSSFEKGAAGKGAWKVEKDELCMTYARASPLLSGLGLGQERAIAERRPAS